MKISDAKGGEKIDYTLQSPKFTIFQRRNIVCRRRRRKNLRFLPPPLVGDSESAQFGHGHVIKSFRQTFFRVLSTNTYHLCII